MRLIVPVTIKPRLGPLRPQTGAGLHKTVKGYHRKPKHPTKEFITWNLMD